MLEPNSPIVMDMSVVEGKQFICEIRDLPPPDGFFLENRDISQVNTELFSRNFELHNQKWICKVSYNLRRRLFISIRCADSEDGYWYYNNLFEVRARIKTLCDIVNKEFCVKQNHKCENVFVVDEFSYKEFWRYVFKNHPHSKKALYLYISISKKITDETEKKNTHKRKLENGLKELLFSGGNSDVNIEVKSETFHCHRCVLQATSPVFCAMFEQNMVEKINGRVIIEDEEPTTFRNFLLYLYTGSLEDLSWKNIIGLYKLADKYAVDDLKNICVKHLKSTFEIRTVLENFFELFLLSQRYNDSELADMTILLFSKKEGEIVRSENWLTFQSEYPNECDVLIAAFDELTADESLRLTNDLFQSEYPNECDVLIADFDESIADEVLIADFDELIADESLRLTNDL